VFVGLFSFLGFGGLFGGVLGGDCGGLYPGLWCFVSKSPKIFFPFYHAQSVQAPDRNNVLAKEARAGLTLDCVTVKT